MKKAVVILIIFTIGSVTTTDEAVENIDMIFFGNMTTHETEDHENPEPFSLRSAKDASCLRCGVSNPKLLGRGRIVTPANKYPWMVYILKTSKQGQNSICGGAIISANFILTAAHCCMVRIAQGYVVQPDDVKVFFISKTARKLVSGPGVERWYPHSGYNGNWEHDICLIKLKRKLRCNQYRRPICLPNANLKISPGQKVILSGWGDEEVGRFLSINPKNELREMTMKIARGEVCQFQGPSLRLLMCIVPFKREFTCQGDSGVPVTRKYQGRHFVIGIYNGRKGKTCSNTPKIANSVTAHLNWIQQVTGITPDYPVSRGGKRFDTRYSRRHPIMMMDSVKPMDRLCMMQRKKMGGIIQRIRYC